MEISSWAWLINLSVQWVDLCGRCYIVIKRPLERSKNVYPIGYEPRAEHVLRVIDFSIQFLIQSQYKHKRISVFRA